jgi:hypothetical protein
MNFSLIPKAFDCLRKGEVLASPGLWKVGGTALAGAIGAALLSINDLARAAGYDLHLTPEVAGALGLAGAWVVGLFFTVATTDKLGVLPAKPTPSLPADRAPDVFEGP